MWVFVLSTQVHSPCVGGRPLLLFYPLLLFKTHLVLFFPIFLWCSFSRSSCVRVDYFFLKHTWFCFSRSSCGVLFPDLPACESTTSHLPRLIDPLSCRNARDSCVVLPPNLLLRASRQRGIHPPCACWFGLHARHDIPRLLIFFCTSRFGRHARHDITSRFVRWSCVGSVVKHRTWPGSMGCLQLTPACGPLTYARQPDGLLELLLLQLGLLLGAGLCSSSLPCVGGRPQYIGAHCTQWVDTFLQNDIHTGYIFAKWIRCQYYLSIFNCQ